MVRGPFLNPGPAKGHVPIVCMRTCVSGHHRRGRPCFCFCTRGHASGGQWWLRRSGKQAIDAVMSVDCIWTRREEHMRHDAVQHATRLAGAMIGGHSRHRQDSEAFGWVLTPLNLTCKAGSLTRKLPQPRWGKKQMTSEGQVLAVDCNYCRR